MRKMLTCWEKCLSLLTPLKREDIDEGKEIFTEDSFTEFLQYCNEKECFPTDDIYTFIRYDVCTYEEGDSNYEEEDYDKKEQLLNVLFANE